MPKSHFNELLAFLTVAEERSFTRAAAKLGLSQPTLSQAIRALEERVGTRLLIRTTRSVSPTYAGTRLFESTGPRLEEIMTELLALREQSQKPTGSFRISATGFIIDHILWPKLKPLLKQHADISLELAVDYGFVDIAASGFDAGVRLGDAVAKDMISVPISPPVRFAVVATKSYFANRSRPLHPQDLTAHRCINVRLVTKGDLYAWEFEKDGRELRVRVEGQLTFNSSMQVVNAALSGFGLAYIDEATVLPHIKAGRLVRVLEEWCPEWSGHHLYYPSRRQSSPAFAMIVEALRYRQ